MRTKTLDRKDDFKRCPYCGSMDISLMKMGYAYYVRCNHCLAHSGTRRTEDEAIERWNKRYVLNECWISCERILPATWEDVLVYYNGEICIGYLDPDDDWEVYGYGEVGSEKITYWRELPESPKYHEV